MNADGSAVVTGASRGIGRAVALELAARGFDTVATMRDPAAGEGLADEAAALGGVLRVERLDVTDPTGFEMPAELAVLVNNAGVERPHYPVEHTPLADWRAMFETNVFGLIEVTRLAIPTLRERAARGLADRAPGEPAPATGDQKRAAGDQKQAAGGLADRAPGEPAPAAGDQKETRGVIVNVTSSSILAPVPFYAVYRASKAAVSALGESLRAEMAAFGVRVLEIMPGPIDTDMLTGSAEPPAALEFEPYRAMAERSHQGRLNVGPMITASSDAARAIVDATLDDDAPLRVGCDPLGLGLLDAWRGQSDEAMMRSMLPAWAGERRLSRPVSGGAGARGRRPEEEA